MPDPISKTLRMSSLDVVIDFTRPDDQRTRPLMVENRRLYVDEHYLSVWSSILRSWCIECPQRELLLPNAKYDNVLEMLLCIHPTYKDVDDSNIHSILPLAFDYQMDGLLHRCECHLIASRMVFLEKLWMADRYKLNRLLVFCLRELRPDGKLDITGPRYYGLSDRVKVLLLERIHGSMAPEEMPEPPLDADQFHRATDRQSASIRAKNGRIYHINAYYVAAWANVVHQRLVSSISDDFHCGCTHEELKAFLLAIHPPQLRITDDCLSTRAKAAILDRLSVLLRNPGLRPHQCPKCKHTAACSNVNWICPKCSGYCMEGSDK